MRENIFFNASDRILDLEEHFFLGKSGLQMKLSEWPGPFAEDWMKHRAIGEEHAKRKLLLGNLV